MPTYKRGLKIGTGWNRREAALGGVSTKGLFTDKDKGKPLKLVSDSTYDICADGDEIEEILVALAGQQPTVNNGYQIGTICDDGQFLGVVGSGTVAVKDFLVAGAQAAIGQLTDPIKPTTALAKVKKAATPAALTYRWRVVSILSGNGAVGSVVLAERVA